MTFRLPRFGWRQAAFSLVLAAAVVLLGAGCTTGVQGSDPEGTPTSQPHVAPGVARSAEGAAVDPTETPTVPAATETPAQQTPSATATSTPTHQPPTPVVTSTPAATSVPTPPQQIELAVATADGTHTVPIMVELATTSGERAVGLSNRDYLAPDDGMLFIFPSMSTSPFWMKDTYVPLDIAYLAADGTIQEIHLGEPLSTDLIHPSQPYRYTLEMNGGWFAANGFGPGDRVVLSGLP